MRARLARGFRWLLIPGLLWFGSMAWQAWKPLPPGLGVEGPWREVTQLRFLADRTWVDAAGQRHSEQEIFDAMLAMIDQARVRIVADQFLFNDFAASPDTAPRALSSELTDALVRRMQEVPGLEVWLVTDPVNTVYGSVWPGHLQDLQAAGARIVITDLSRLRASNVAWTGPWALCCGWAGNRVGGGWLPNPFSAEPVTLRSWLSLLNFRANHRKTLIVDRDGDWQALVSSANPHDASSAHGNVALQFSGPAALDVMQSELAVVAFSGEQPPPSVPANVTAEPSSGARLRLLTEAAIRDAALEAIGRAGAGDHIDLAMFYLAHRDVIQVLQAARARGAQLRVLLDPNRDAFGRSKNGVPNRQVARELEQAGIPVRWCDTHGEQCHAKLLLVRSGGAARLLAGSANFTRRNLDDLNLETSVELAAPVQHAEIGAALAWFEEAWGNPPGRRFSVAYENYADDALLRRAWYRVGERLGLSTW